MDQANQAAPDQRRRLKMARTRAQLVEGRRDWFRITNLGDDRAELFVYDEIGYFGVSASDLVEQLSALKVSNLSVRLSSPGGDVFDGIAIMNALRSHPARVTVQVDSIAASIASVIAMAGDEVVMAPHSEMMIHEASGVAVGDAATMREMADLLDRQSDKIAGIYAERAGGQRPSWRKRMRDETWYSAQEAVAAGLADRVADMPRQAAPAEGQDEPDGDEPMHMAASWDLSIFRYPGRGQAPDPSTNHAEPVPAVVDTAVGPHDTPTAEGTWDAGDNAKRLPSPMPVATAKKVYASYDETRVEDGMVPKDACKLPHHLVGEDGTPGAASLNGVRNALARLPQTEGLSDDERTTIENHLRAHLADAEDTTENTTGVEVTAQDGTGPVAGTQQDTPAPDDGQAPGSAPAPAAEAGPAPEPDPAPDPVPTETVPGPDPVDDWAASTAHLNSDDWNTLVAPMTSDNAVFARLRENLL